MKKIISVIAAGLAIVACSKPEAVESVKGEGMLRLGVSVEASTKAALSAEALESTAKVSIYKADFSGLVREYTYGQMPEVMYLSADEYRVDVEAGETVKENPAAASWEQKSYKGSKAFTIAAGQTTSVEVVASVNNAVTNISFDSSVTENFNPGFTLSVALDPENEASKLVYDASKSGNDGYFIIAGLYEPSFTWTFNGTLAKNGEEFTKSGVIENIEAGKVYKMALRYTIKDGDLGFSLVVDYGTDIVDDTIIFEPVSTGLSSSSAFEIWAGHATVHADVDTSEYADAEVKFAFSADGVNWTEVAGVNEGNGAWSAVLTGLAGSTEYTYKLIIDGEEVGDPKTLTTEPATRIPNGGFEAASLVSGASYYKFYDPNAAEEDGRFMFWGSGNGEGKEGVNGSASMGIVITAVDTDVKVEGNQSVRAQSSSMVGILAAGNVFTGQFAGLVGTSGGKVNFGRPWTTRPTAMRLWVKYTTDKINILKSLPDGESLTKDDYDRAEIKFALGTWDYKKYGGTKDSPVLVNTTNSATFVDYTTDPSTVAYSNIVIYNDGYMLNFGEKVSATTDQWFQITMPLDYHSETVYPTHIIISCASSQYGDYFTGCDKSKLWIDAVELLYE